MLDAPSGCYEIHLTFSPVSKVFAFALAEGIQALVDLMIQDNDGAVLTALTVAHTKVFDSRG